MKLRVFVCDDEELIRSALTRQLENDGYDVLALQNGQACLDALQKIVPDAIVLDLAMPVLDGLTVLRRLRANEIGVPVVVLTARNAPEAVIEATELGAASYLHKPFDLREFSLMLRRVIQNRRLELEVEVLRSRQQDKYGKLVGNSPALLRVLDLLKRLEGVNAPTVLLQGESGTGKDLVAQAIHSQGMRKRGLFMEVDCASLPEALIESTLFGHEKGAFTDATHLKLGLFETARGGTIFLDEIGEMSLGTQVKLLRAIENRRFKRVGGVSDIPLDAGVIAATHRDLMEEVRAGRFREDLFFRLNVIQITMPPLRSRPDDIPLLASHFLGHFSRHLGRAPRTLSGEVIEAFRRYSWPGNVRELRNVIERNMILETGDQVQLEHLPPEILRAAQREMHAPAQEQSPAWTRVRGEAGSSSVSSPPPATPAPLPSPPASTATSIPLVAGFVLPPEGIELEALERSLVAQALERTEGNQSAAARLLGISRYALRYRLEKLRGESSPAPQD